MDVDLVIFDCDGVLVDSEIVSFEAEADMLAEIGLEPERLEMFNLSSAEGGRFAEIVMTMVERVKRMGRSPLRPKPDRMEQEVQEISRQAEAMLAGENR